MPEAYQARLKDLVSSTPSFFQILPCAYQDNFIEVSNKAFFKELEKNNYSHLFSSRIDDDDAIAPNFLEALVKDASLVNWSGFISYPQGIFLQLNKAQEAQYGLGYRWPNIGIGLTMVSPIQDGKPIRKPNIFQHGNHLKIKSTLVERPLMFVRSGHEENDQGNVSAKPELRHYKTETDRHLLYPWIQDLFSITLPMAKNYNGWEH